MKLSAIKTPCHSAWKGISLLTLHPSQLAWKNILKTKRPSTFQPMVLWWRRRDSNSRPKRNPTDIYERRQLLFHFKKESAMTFNLKLSITVPGLEIGLNQTISIRLIASCISDLVNRQDGLTKCLEFLAKKLSCYCFWSRECRLTKFDNIRCAIYL